MLGKDDRGQFQCSFQISLWCPPSTHGVWKPQLLTRLINDSAIHPYLHLISQPARFVLCDEFGSPAAFPWRRKSLATFVVLQPSMGRTPDEQVRGETKQQRGNGGSGGGRNAIVANERQAMSNNDRGADELLFFKSSFKMIDRQMMR